MLSVQCEIAIYAFYSLKTRSGFAFPGRFFCAKKVKQRGAPDRRGSCLCDFSGDQIRMAAL